MTSKIQTILEANKRNNIDLFCFSNPQTIAYLTGYHSEPHERVFALFISPHIEPVLVLPAMEVEDAKKVVSTIQLMGYHDHENAWEKVSKLYAAVPHERISIEFDHVTLSRLKQMQAAFPSSEFDFDCSPMIQQLRLQKSDDELQFLREAGKWADRAIEIGKKFLRVGVTEEEVVAHIEYELKKQGISELSFDTMVLFGTNAASPHGTPGKNRLEENQFVLMDLGVKKDGYVSDITRTLFFGEHPSKLQWEVYHVVKNAYQTAKSQARIGMTAEELDDVARSVIVEAGYGDFFTHRLGHGIGMDVHEYPSLMEGNTMELLPHMCFSIEPGIYIPDAVGVRIEDCGYLDEDGFHSFTSYPTNIPFYE